MSAIKGSKLMTVGELVRKAGVTVRTIQYYDQKGLLSPTTKSSANLRLYSEEDEEQLYRIITLKYLGYSLAQIKDSEHTDDMAQLAEALSKRSAQLEETSIETFRDINTIHALRARFEGKGVMWGSLASAIADTESHEDALWTTLVDGEESITPLSDEELSSWRKLIEESIEAMRAGVSPQDREAKELASRLLALGGLASAPNALHQLACLRGDGPRQYDREFYAGIMRRVLAFLDDAAESGDFI